MSSELCLPSGKSLSMLTVKELQKELQQRSLSKSGKKADLLGRLTEFFNQNERNQGDLGDENTASKTSEDRITPAEIPCNVGGTAERKQKRTRKSRRSSNTRLNETFDLIDDTEDSTQPNVTVTPTGNSAISLEDVCHRKSSRANKDRKCGGDEVNSPLMDTVRGQTPRSSKRASHPIVFSIDQTGSPNAVEQREMENTTICTECIEKEEHVSLPNETASSNSGCTRESDSLTETQPAAEARTGDTADKENISSQRETITLQSEYTGGSGPERIERSILPAAKLFDVAPLESGGISTPKNAVHSNLHPTPASTKRRGIHTPTISSSARNAARKTSIRTKSATSLIERLPSSSRSIKKASRGDASKSFARQHAQLFSQMETIGDHQEKVARRHAENMQAVPDAVKRLATPKSLQTSLSRHTTDTFTKRTGHLFDASNAKQTVTENSFNFGKAEDFSATQGQSASSTVVNSFSLKQSKSQNKRDVKTRTKNAVRQMKWHSATLPVNRESINLLATPKGMTPSKPRGKVSYTPHRGAVGTFIDTTKLSDREFELAVANGLIKARSAKSRMQLEASRRTRREDIITVKRKLKIVQ